MTQNPRRVALMLDLQWPYQRHVSIFAGTQQYAEEHGWLSIIDEFVHKTLPVRRGAVVPYDGIIARANRQLVARTAHLGLPLVNVWQSSPVRHSVPGVYPDSTAVGGLLAEHLLARGFRNFAALFARNNVDHELEVKEFVRVVHEAGFPCLSQQTPHDPWQDFAQWQKSKRLIEQWMDEWQHPIGVYVGDEVEGRIVTQECHRRGWRVPADAAIIAGKNQELLCEHPRPSLTSIEIGYERIGYEAARLLDRLMEGEPEPTEPIRLPPQGLVVRESTDFLAVENDLVASALRFISTNSHRRIGPDNVAQAVGVETRTLQNYFRKFLHRPIATEIRRVRLERAKRELAQGNRSLSAIARDVGFGDSLRMCEVFRRELGMTPSAYRRQRQLEIE